MKIAFFILLVFISTSVGFSQTNEEPILVDVDVKPTWSGCDTDAEERSRELCFENKLTAFFNDFIIYPEKARKRKTEGQVIAQFVVEKDGSISNIQIIHDIGDGCGDEVIRAIQHLPKLIPGMNNGAAVRVLYKAPFNFVLK